jgi:2-amino-4-hydroxy-6-hydroxymethyldihydropteridine diphosphokinase
MANVLIALGSNYHQSAHILWASQRLAALLADVTLSPILWTPDIHGRGLWYMNRLLRARTMLSPTQLTALLKQIEQETQRTKQHVTIDLDLMQYDDQHFHLDDWQRPYIQNLIGFM